VTTQRRQAAPAPLVIRRTQMSAAVRAALAEIGGERRRYEALTGCCSSCRVAAQALRSTKP
jgi:hypothetical protein